MRRRAPRFPSRNGGSLNMRYSLKARSMGLRTIAISLRHRGRTRPQPAGVSAQDVALFATIARSRAAAQELWTAQGQKGEGQMRALRVPPLRT